MRALPTLLLSTSLLIPLIGCGGDIPDQTSSPTPEVTPTEVPVPVDADKDGVPLPEDCNDGDPTIKPGAVETCNSKDDNCNNQVDEDASDVLTFFADADNDGFGNAEVTKEACSAPSGYVENSGDCDDSKGNINPDGTEVCGDGVDNNCDNGAPGCGLVGNLSLGDASATLTGAYAGDGAGEAVSMAGDFNCDGDLDILIGAPSASPTDADGAAQTAAGAAYVVFGTPSSGSLSQADVMFLGDEAGARAGQSLASLGDINGDGCDDLAIGAPFSDRGGDRSGIVYIFFGGAERSGTYSVKDANAKLVGASSRDGAGFSITGVGDVNGDRTQDFLIGAYTATVPSAGGDLAYGGKAHLLYGPLTGNIDLSDADVTFYGESPSGLAGKVTGVAGDLNDDGKADLVIAAPDLDYNNNANSGVVYVLYYPFMPDSTGMVPLAEADAHIAGAAAEELGTSLAGGADLNKDGVQDLLVGAASSSRAGTEAGVVYGFLGPVVGHLTGDSAGLRFLGEGSGARLGGAVAVAGDINGDGHQDVAMTTMGDAKGRTVVRAAYILHGPFAPEMVVSAETAAARIASTSTTDMLGSALSAGSDWNGDGTPDLMVGVGSQSSGTSEYGGAAYLFFGGKGL